MKAVLLLSLAACGSEPVVTPPPENGQPGSFALSLQQVATGLSRPVYVTSPPNDSRLFVVEQAGRIRVISGGTLLSQPFLDIRDSVTSLGGLGDERGMLGLAFHPHYATNGYFYVNYTNLAGDTRVKRYTRSADPNVANPASGYLILGVDQPFGNHNGGQLLFGPDGLLYIPLGDGGGSGGPNSQSLTTLLGKILRIDVDAGAPYAIPAGNPFAGQAGARQEIWGLGLRNPWRNSFDRGSDLLFVADVGQNREEEINAVSRGTPGVNYGWPVMEGSSCAGSGGCDQSGLMLPVHTYPTAGGSCAVTGGYVYRGAAIPEIAGHYFYSDYCRGGLRSLRVVGATAQDFREWDVGSTGNISSFGEDAQGELYLVALSGTIWRIVRAP